MTSPYHFLALGNSYTIGTGVAPEDRWPHQLYKLLAQRGVDLSQPTILARNGWTSGDLLAALEREKYQGRFHLVSLQIGANDQYNGVPLAIYARHFQSLLDRILRLNGGDPRRILVLPIPDWSATPFADGRGRSQIAEESERFNHVNRRIAGEVGARYIDINPPSRAAVGDKSLLAEDGLHPSGKAYRLWVERLLPTAEDILRLAA